MRSWAEVWSFVRGTRQRPPPGPSRPAATLLLYASAFAHLPLVYLLVDAALPPAVALAIGLLAMGLAWSGGVALEGRRIGTTRLLAGASVAEGALAFLPPVVADAGMMRWLFLAIAALGAGTLLLLARRD